MNILEEVLVVIEMVVDQQVDGKVLIHKVYNIPPPGLYFGKDLKPLGLFFFLAGIL